MSVMILWILLKYPFLIKLMPSILMAWMPLWMMLTKTNFLFIVPYVKHEIVAIAPTLECDGLHLSYHPKNRVENNTRVLVGHEQHDLCDSYILDVVHDATENYFERGTFGCRNIHVTKTPLFMLKVSKLFFFYLPMLVTLCFHDLFVYKFPKDRKWVRLKCVSHLLLDALVCFNPYSFVSIFCNLQA